ALLHLALQSGCDDFHQSGARVVVALVGYASDVRDNPDAFWRRRVTSLQPVDRQLRAGRDPALHRGAGIARSPVAGIAGAGKAMKCWKVKRGAAWRLPCGGGYPTGGWGC